MSKKPQRYCKRCGIKVGKRKSYCPDCVIRRNKYKKCGFESCKELRGFRIHSCEYHSSKNRHIRYMEEIVKCRDCGCDLGKRKNYRRGNKRICNDCWEIQKENSRKKQLIYYRKWFKNKYHTDEGFRKRYMEYQKNYSEMKNKKLKIKRSQK